MSKKESIRPLANFPPSLWGDRFLNFSLDNLELESYAKAMEDPQEQVRRLITNPTTDSNKKLCLINHIYRLGLTYIFMQEIDGQLDKLFNELNLQEYEGFDLYTTSLNFQVFRQLGYKLTCDVFSKFKDDKFGTFKEHVGSDVKGLLGFYESSQLRIRGEDILEEANAFTETRLKSLVNTLEGNLARQVEHAVIRPFHRGMPMVEARLYFSIYKKELSSYDSLCKLAKAHFNYLQLLQKEELSIVSKWWKDIDFQTIPYARDRITELYLWILALFLEPYYSQARIITTKIIQLVLILDDTYDAFATIEELRLLTDAINRWDITAMEQLPDHIKPFYKIILNEYEQLGKEFAKEGRPNTVRASKEAMMEMIVNMDCHGCERKVRKALQNLEGVESIDIDMNLQKVTVTGWLDHETVLSKLRRAGKKAELWPFPNNPHMIGFTQQYADLYPYHSDPASYFHGEQQPAAYEQQGYLHVQHHDHFYDDGYEHVNVIYDQELPAYSSNGGGIIGERASIAFSDENVNACSIM